jgi:hypothetical protein
VQKLVHEIWEDFGEEGESLPDVCFAGPDGDDFRRSLGPQARLTGTFEAGSQFEAMTIYYELMNWGKYTPTYDWDYEPYPEEWVRRQRHDMQPFQGKG